MPNKPTPEQLDAIVRELREAEVLADMPNPAFEDACRYDGLCRQHMPAILDALEAKDAELKAALAVIDKYQTLQRLKGRPTSTQWGENADADEIRAENSQYQRVVDQTLQDYLAEYGKQGGKG